MGLFDAPQHIALPPPISLNKIYANVRGKGRVKTQRYNTWCWHAEALLMQQAPLPRFIGPVKIHYFVGQSGIGQMDAGNVEKAYTDALVRAGVILDDNKKHLRGISVEWVKDMAGCVASITPSDSEPSAADVAALVSMPDAVEVRRRAA